MYLSFILNRVNSLELNLTLVVKLVVPTLRSIYLKSPVLLIKLQRKEIITCSISC